MDAMDLQKAVFVELAAKAAKRVDDILAVKRKWDGWGHTSNFLAGQLAEAKWWLKVLTEAAAEPNPYDEVAPG